jgi:hypothetical protein
MLVAPPGLPALAGASPLSVPTPGWHNGLPAEPQLSERGLPMKLFGREFLARRAKLFYDVRRLPETTSVGAAGRIGCRRALQVPSDHRLLM